MKKDELISYLTNQKESFLKRFGIIKIGLFGSVLKNEKPSDIDIIVEFEPGTQDLFDKKNTLRQLIEKQFHLPVDICREKFIRPSVKKMILKDAIFV